MEENFIIESWRESLHKVIAKDEGQWTLYFILLNLGYFAPVYAKDKDIFRNAALKDAALWLEGEIFDADPATLIKIKQLHKYNMEMNQWTT